MLPFSLRRRTASLHTIAIFTVFLSHARPIHGAPDSIGQWLNSALPQPGSTLKDEMLCYALPFGAIGFASHLLTYYTLHMLLAARSPWSFKRNKHWKMDTLLGVVSLLSTTITSIFTIVRCRGSWQFVVLAVWKMILSLNLGFVSVHTALNLRKGVYEKHPWARGNDSVALSGPAMWCAISLWGIMAGCAGIFDLVHKSWHLPAVKGLTAGLIVFTALLYVLGFVYVLNHDKWDRFDDDILPGMTLGWVGICSIALYSDWILAAIADDWTGVPDGNNAVLYWIYFAAKRLTMASF